MGWIIWDTAWIILTIFLLVGGIERKDRFLTGISLFALVIWIFNISYDILRYMGAFN